MSILRLAALSLLSASALAQSIPPAVKSADASIDPEKIRAHVKFLSDDLLEGRGPGMRGDEIAAQYIATQFALYGLKPGGDNGAESSDDEVVEEGDYEVIDEEEAKTS